MDRPCSISRDGIPDNDILIPAPEPKDDFEPDGGNEEDGNIHEQLSSDMPT